MIYKISKHIISKHQTLFLDSEMSKYCGTSGLNLQVKNIDKFITKFIDKNKYYFHDQSSILIPEGSKRNHFNQIKNFFSKILFLPLLKKLEWCQLITSYIFSLVNHTGKIKKNHWGLHAKGFLNVSMVDSWFHLGFMPYDRHISGLMVYFFLFSFPIFYLISNQ